MPITLTTTLYKRPDDGTPESYLSEQTLARLKRPTETAEMREAVSSELRMKDCVLSTEVFGMSSEKCNNINIFYTLERNIMKVTAYTNYGKENHRIQRAGPEEIPKRTTSYMGGDEILLVEDGACFLKSYSIFDIKKILLYIFFCAT